MLTRGRQVIAIEVKSGRRKTTVAGLDAFAAEFPVHRKLLVGGQGIPAGAFLATPADAWF